MPLLTLKARLFDISFIQDGLTIYLKAESEVVEEMCTPQFAADTLLKTIKGKYPDIALIHNNDNAHHFYHKGDDFSQSEQHMHIKFSSILTKDHFSFILEKLELFCIIDPDQKQAFKKAVSNRYAEKERKLNETLTLDNVNADIKIIISLIKECDFNDILVHIHQYLLQDQFNYLRQYNTSNSVEKCWQGTDQAGNVVATSKEWAMLEKAIALQMVRNVKQSCTDLTKNLAVEYADKFAQSYRFFAIKRNAKPKAPVSKIVNAFRDLNMPGFEAGYNKHFKL